MTYEEEITMANYLYNQWLKEEHEKEIEKIDNRYEQMIDDYFEMV